MYIYLFIYGYIFIFFIHTLSYKIIDTLIKLKYVCMYLQKEKNKVNFFFVYLFSFIKEKLLRIFSIFFCKWNNYY